MSSWPSLLASVRNRAGLSQLEWAALAATSRPTLSAYEHGRKAPTADTLERLIASAGFRLDVAPVVRWSELTVAAGRTCWVPNRLWRLPPDEALADIVLPLELNWSAPGRRFVTRDRRQRARLYELLLREGTPSDLERWVDGALLADGWHELVLPRAVRAAWQPVLEAVLVGAGAEQVS